MLTTHGQQIELLDTKIRKLADLLHNLTAEEDIAELIRHMRHPGWTRPVDFLFVNAILDVMTVQTESLISLKSELIKGSRAILEQAMIEREPEVVS